MENTEATGFWLRHSGREWTAGELNRTLRRFCDPCNSGWMSALEDQARPLLEPMILSRNRRTIFPAAQETIAIWAYKMMLVTASGQPGVIPTRHYQEFHATRQAPDGLRVWAGTVGGDRPDGGHALHRLELEESPYEGPHTPDAYSATFHGHRLLLQVMFYGGFGQPNVDVDDRFFTQIWPPTNPYAVWGNRFHADQDTVRSVIRGETTFLIF